MITANHLRAEIEAALADRIPSALTPLARMIRPTAPTGIPQLDELLTGGLPVGAISEITGPECSGRTSLALAFLARATSQGKVCAWVDVSDALHPESAAAAGIDLDRLLWVRCGGMGQKPHPPKSDPPDGIDSPVARSPLPQTTRTLLGGNSPHPRSESRGLPLAICNLLEAKSKYQRDRITGTPGAPNRPLGANAIAAAQPSRVEQVASDRLPARRGNYVLEQREAYAPRCAEAQHKPRPIMQSYRPSPAETKPANAVAAAVTRPWALLDQAMRVTDLLLQAGGFSAIVLDMGNIPAEFASRVPLATWFRYRAAAERTQASLLLLTQHPCAKSSAGAVLRLDGAQPDPAGATVFAGLTNRVELSRRRFEPETEKVISIKKPPQRAESAEWQSRSTWTARR